MNNSQAQNMQTPFSLIMNADGCMAGVVALKCNNMLYELEGIRVRLENGGEQVTDTKGRFSFCGLAINVSHLIEIRPEFKIDKEYSYRLVSPNRFSDVLFELPCQYDYVAHYTKSKIKK